MNILFLFALLLIAISSDAQREKIWGDPHVYQKFATTASTNPAYTKLRADVDALGKAATPSNTNAAAVKALFKNNSAVLRGLYTNAGMEPPKTMSLRKTVPPVIKSVIRNSIIAKLKLFDQNMIKVKVPPFFNDWLAHSGHSNDGGYPDTSASNFNTGKIAFTTNFFPPCDVNPGYSGCKTGYCLKGYIEKFTVPSNPEIIAAEIKVEYAYLYTGWDTYGAITELNLVARTNNKFNSTAYNELPEGPMPADNYGLSPADRGKNMGILYARDTVDTEFAEFHATGESSFTLEGYVTPGSEIELMAGFGYPSGTKRGTIGCYHYAELMVKKITIRYFKSAN